MNSNSQQKTRKRWKILWWSLGMILALLSLAYGCFVLSPIPGAWLIKQAFESDGKKVNQALAPYVPNTITSVLNEPYAPGDADAHLDVYYPQDTAKGQQLATVFWIHGGGWVAGTKELTANYGKIIAGKGFTVVVIDYSLAPKKHYPYQIQQVNQALAYVCKHAKRLHIDPNLLFLAGDSGGANMAAQYANLVTVPAYAAMLGIQPFIRREQLAGVLLYCGPYDVGLASMEGGLGWFTKTVSWAYTGNKKFMSAPEFKAISVIHYVNADFPPTYISVGNADLLAPHSKALSRKLAGLGVSIDTLFFPQAYEPALSHEYQFNLRTEAGQQALDHSVAFIELAIRHKTNR